MSASPEHIEYVLRLADNALVLGQRLSQWCGHGPALEEDIALTNISLDLVGQARLLLSHAANLEGLGRDEDTLAFFRDEPEFRNYTLLELPNGEGPHDDYAVTVMRNLFASALACPLWQALSQSTDAQLAAIAAKSVKEARAHFRHAREWVICFGDGTQTSHERAQRALDRLWPYTNEFWAEDAVERAVATSGVGLVTATLRPAWDSVIDEVLREAGLHKPPPCGFVSTGKLGVHSEYLGFMLVEMQSLARAHPGARW
jgi:ring-1,2-phenylacetyl-CoA epoxidase subunit PaaC